MKVSEIMTGTVELVKPETSVRDAAKRMADEDVGALPVGADEKLVGMVTDRDIAVRAVGAGKPIDDCNVKDVMSGGVLYCVEDADCSEVADNMAENKVRRLPVVNRDKHLVGIISLGDIATGTEHAGLSGATVEAVSREAI